MIFDIEVDAGPRTEDALVSLYDWLTRERIANATVTRLPAQRRTDELGASWLDAIRVEIEPGGPMSALAGALAVWLRLPRRSPPNIIVTRGPDHARLVIENVQDADEQQLSRRLSEFSRGGEP
jgi:Effector Associated Constant Component 1